MPTPSPILLTGATGFVGAHVLSELLSRGHRLHCLVRDPSRLPRHDAIAPFPGSITDPATIAPAAAGCAAAIHLVGIIAETRTQTFAAIHEAGTRNVITAATAAGVTRFIHMSALGTRPNAPSAYHQTKWAAEEIVRASTIPFTIFRPSLIHGPGGEFTLMLKNWSTGKAPPFLFMPYFGTGLLGQRNTHLLQPVHVQNVAWLFAQALTTPASIGKTYDVGGPARYTWPQLLSIASTAFRGKPKRSLGIPVWLAKALTALPLPLPFNRDQILMSQEPNTADLAPLQADFPAFAPLDFQQSIRAYAPGI